MMENIFFFLSLLRVHIGWLALVLDQNNTKNWLIGFQMVLGRSFKLGWFGLNKN